MPKTKEPEVTASGEIIEAKTFRVFNHRWELVAQVTTETEAEQLAAAHRGTYKLTT